MENIRHTLDHFCKTVCHVHIFMIVEFGNIIQLSYFLPASHSHFSLAYSFQCFLCLSSLYFLVCFFLFISFVQCVARCSNCFTFMCVRLCVHFSLTQLRFHVPPHVSGYIDLCTMVGSAGRSIHQEPRIEELGRSHSANSICWL